MRAQDLQTGDDLVLVHKPLGVGRSQELSHLDGPRLAIFLALPAEPRARKPPGGRGERACRDSEEQGEQHETCERGRRVHGDQADRRAASSYLPCD